MKKTFLILSCATLILTSTLSLATVVFNNNAPADDCPGYRPNLKLPEKNTKYYYPTLEKLEELTEVSTPLLAPLCHDFLYEPLCKLQPPPNPNLIPMKPYNSACDVLKVVHQRNQIAMEWNNSETVQQWRNYIIEVKKNNDEIKQKNKRIYYFMNSKIRQQIERLNGIPSWGDTGGGMPDIPTLSVKIEPIPVPFMYSSLPSITPFEKMAMRYFQSLPEFCTRMDTSKWEIIERDSQLNNYLATKAANDRVIAKNQEIERKNAEVMKQFYDFYTPEKLNQLLNDYTDLLETNCTETPKKLKQGEK